MKETNCKGQAAMEYLQTYGWAILIIIVVAAIFLYLTSTLSAPQYCFFDQQGMSCSDPVPVIAQDGKIFSKLINGYGNNIIVRGFLCVDKQDLPNYNDDRVSKEMNGQIVKRGSAFLSGDYNLYCYEGPNVVDLEKSSFSGHIYLWYNYVNDPATVGPRLMQANFNVAIGDGIPIGTGVCGDDSVQCPNSAGFCETCDGDGCTESHQSCVGCTCQEVTYCGDGEWQPTNGLGVSEECDGLDMGLNDPDVYRCTSDCTIELLPADCGNSIREDDEECDYGNLDHPDFISGTGPDGLSNSNTEPNSCRVDCTLPSCSDDVLDAWFDEQCVDDSDCALYHECNDCHCEVISYCGDAELNRPNDNDFYEQCDDGEFNIDNVPCILEYGSGDVCDYCDTSCRDHVLTADSCGDGFFQSEFEGCEHGDIFCRSLTGGLCNQDTCQCTGFIPECGNGVPGETLLDGRVEQCDTGILNGLLCDAPYNGLCQYCNDSCYLQTVEGGSCGDGNLDIYEECDASVSPSGCAEEGVCNGCTCEYSNTLNVVIEGTGRVFGTSPINCPTHCTGTYDNQWVFLNALPYDNNYFVGWFDDIGEIATCGSASCPILVDQDMTVYARFGRQPTLTVSLVGYGYVMGSDGSIDCGDQCFNYYDYGDSVGLSAIADDGYVFSHWSGNCIGTICNLIMDDSKTVTAHFTVIPEPKVCGDDTVDNPNDAGVVEECDDGIENTNVPCTASYGSSCTYCDTSCVERTILGGGCGNGRTEGDEQCDDGNQVNEDACRNDCTLPYCGDNIIDSGEDCDSEQLGECEACNNCQCVVGIDPGCNGGYNNNLDGSESRCSDSQTCICEDGSRIANEWCEMGRLEILLELNNGDRVYGCGTDMDGDCELSRGEYWGDPFEKYYFPRTQYAIGEEPYGTAWSGEPYSLDCLPDEYKEDYYASCDNDGVCEDGENYLNCIDCSCGSADDWDAVYYTSPVDFYLPGAEFRSIVEGRSYDTRACQQYLGETSTNCPRDCGCDNDNKCEILRGETFDNCDDCNLCNADAKCDNTYTGERYNSGESLISCPTDCLELTKQVCGDNFCANYDYLHYRTVENEDNCPRDCSGFCGDDKCQPNLGEDANNCNDCKASAMCSFDSGLGLPQGVYMQPFIELVDAGDVIYANINNPAIEPNSAPDCGDGICMLICGETINSCPDDCGLLPGVTG